VLSIRKIIEMKIFIINGGQKFAHSGGSFNTTITNWTVETLAENGLETRVTNINDDFDPMVEVENFKWADIIVYHFPVWWFQVPNRLKLYIDEVFTAGYNKSILKKYGWSPKKTAPNYCSRGLMDSEKKFVTSSWNAPETAFTMENEFFDQHSVDAGVLFGFHKMNQFAGLEHLGSFHFHDMEKGASQERVDNYEKEYKQYLEEVFHLETTLN